MACGCSGGDTDGQGVYGEGRGVLTGKDLYKKTYIKRPEGTPFAFLVERGNGTGEVVRKDIGGCGESQIKQEIDKKMLDAVLGENGEKKEKSQKNEKN